MILKYNLEMKLKLHQLSSFEFKMYSEKYSIVDPHKLLCENKIYLPLKEKRSTKIKLCNFLK